MSSRDSAQRIPTFGFGSEGIGQPTRSACLLDFLGGRKFQIDEEQTRIVVTDRFANTRRRLLRRTTVRRCLARELLLELENLAVQPVPRGVRPHVLHDAS